MPAARRCTNPTSPRQPRGPPPTRQSSTAQSCWHARLFALPSRPENGTVCWKHVLSGRGHESRRRRCSGGTSRLRGTKRWGGAAPMTLSDVANSWLAAHNDDLVGWRRHIHRYPELGRQEYATTQFVAERLVEAGLNPKVLPGGTGLTCDFGPDREPRIALRADMDALPMAERTGAAYASTMPNAAHACGHDGHTAILLGTALALAGAPELPVGLRLVFQPAEELMPGGAIDTIAAGAMSGVSRIFALHCDPRLEVGKIAV